MSATDPLQQRLAFMGFDARARSKLKSLKPLIGKSIGPALAAFYDKVRQTPETLRFFKDDKHMAGARSRQEQHWEIIGSADYGETYVRAVKGIGEAHARLGLEPRWYIGGYAAGHGTAHPRRRQGPMAEPAAAEERRRRGDGGVFGGLDESRDARHGLRDLDLSRNPRRANVGRAEQARQDAERKTAHAMQVMAKSLERLAAGRSRVPDRRRISPTNSAS